ncbi:MAG: hypothetical protein AAF597_09010, partial [Bacteroidota bacterium]
MKYLALILFSICYLTLSSQSSITVNYPDGTQETFATADVALQKKLLELTLDDGSTKQFSPDEVTSVT